MSFFPTPVCCAWVLIVLRILQSRDGNYIVNIPRATKPRCRATLASSMAGNYSHWRDVPPETGSNTEICEQD